MNSENQEYGMKVALFFYQIIFSLSAKRAGDYYMFDYDPTMDKLVEPVESFVPEVTPGASDFNQLDPAQVTIAIVDI